MEAWHRTDLRACLGSFFVVLRGVCFGASALRVFWGLGLRVHTGLRLSGGLGLCTSGFLQGFGMFKAFGF